MKAYVFTTKTAANAALDLMHPVMAEIARERGFTVLPPFSVIGKNAATGQDNPDVVTSVWAAPAKTVNGKWFIPSVREVFKTTYQRVEAAAGATEVDVEPLPPPALD